MELVTPKAAEATKLIITCIVVGIVSCSSMAVLQYRYVSSEPGNHRQVTPIHPPDAPAHITSCMELQCLLNRRDPTLKLKEDGICGPATQTAWDDAVNTQYALGLWPEDAK